jgi:hypothetical protein
VSTLRRRRLITVLVACGLTATIGVVWAAWTYLPRALGLCPYPTDARAYAQHGCAVFQAVEVTTFDQGLEYYRLPMPADAQGVRFYIDPGAFNGGDAFYLRFSASPAEMAAFLAKLHAVKGSEGAEAAWTDGLENQDAGTVPWSFEDSARYAVYEYTVKNDPDTAGGTVTVDQTSAEPVAYVYAAGLD